jgi:HTH-type transcriptional regulator, competence development regulator
MDSEMDASLGKYLKRLRDARALSLREVEGQTGVSNAFLSQVESGKVKKPSPAALYKLADFYDVPYEKLMELAGYPVPSGETTTARSTSAIFKRLGEITEEEEHALLDYLAFLRSRSKKGGRKS